MLSLAVDAEGALVSTGHDGFIAFWDMAAGKQKRIERGPNRLTILSPDGRLYGTRDTDKGELQITETATGRKLRALKIAEPKKGGWMAMTILSRELAIANGGYSADMAALAFSRDAGLLASAGSGVKIWEVATGKQQMAITGPSGITAVAFSPDAKLLATGSLDHTTKLFDVASGRELRTLAGHKSVVQAVVFSPDGKLVATGSWDNTVKLWEVETGREVRAVGMRGTWEVKRAQLGECGAQSPGDTAAKAEPGQLYCTVSVTVRNISSNKAWFPTRHYKVFLHQPPTTQEALRNTLWKGERETVQGQAMGEAPRYVAVGAGEEAEFSLIFRVPEQADRKALFLVVLDAPPIPLGS